MSETSYRRTVYGLLYGVICKQAWGETLDYFDPGDLLEGLEPAFEEAIEAMDDRNRAVEILLELYERVASDSEAISMLFRANGSITAMAEAGKKAVEKVGMAAVELLSVGLLGETDGERAFELLFEICRFAVTRLENLEQASEVLRTSYRRARQLTDEPFVVNALAAGCKAAPQLEGWKAIETRLDYYQEAAFNAGEPWPFLEPLTENLEAVFQLGDSDQPPFDAFMRAFAEELGDQDVQVLWEYYGSVSHDLGQYERAEALIEMYEKAVVGVTDPRWFTNQVFKVFSYIADAENIDSVWLPDRQRLCWACTEVIEAEEGKVAFRDVMAEVFEAAIYHTDDPWRLLAELFREVMARADDDAKSRIADVLVLALENMIRDVCFRVLGSAQRVIEDREAIVDLLLEAAEWERSFGIFQRLKKATERNRSREVEWFVNTLPEGAPNNDHASVDEPLDTQLFRAFQSAAGALDDATLAANLLATIHMKQHQPATDVAIEHAARVFSQAVTILADPASEGVAMYNACFDVIHDEYEAGIVLEPLLDAAKGAIEGADDPASAIEMLLSNLYVKPASGALSVPRRLIAE